jgi:predicted outer membrane repeat protein
MVKNTIRFLLYVVWAIALAGCGLAGGTPATTATQSLPSGTSAPSYSLSPSESASPTVTAAPTNIPLTAATVTPLADAVLVNTYEQELYPFEQNSNCSLEEAIWTVETQHAQDGCVLPSGSTTISLMPGTYSLTTADASEPPLPGAVGRLGFGPGGLPIIYTKVTILGNGATIQRSSQTPFGIFQVTAGGDLTLDDLTVTGGDSSSIDLSEGGAIELLVGQVNLNNVTLTGNRSYDGGAISVGFGASMTMNNSVVQGNTATDDGGGIYNSGTLVLQNSTISANVAQDDTIGGGGIYNDAGQVTLDHSEMTGNLATEGGGIYNDSGTVSIMNGSYISGNLADEQNSDIPHGGGGINNIASSGFSATLTIDASYIIGNQAPGSTGGGIYNQGTLIVTNSVLAQNVSSGGGALFNDVDGQGSISGSCLLQNQVEGVTPEGFGSNIESGSDTSFVASQNWWGSVAGPGNDVTPGVDTVPVLNSAPAVCAANLPTPFPLPATP